MTARRTHSLRESGDVLVPGKANFALNASRLNAVRALLVIVMAFGYASTMARGPGTAEFGRLFGYEPSLFAIKTLFFLSGFLVMRSLARHGSALKMLASRARRNLIPLTLVTMLVAFIVYPIICEDTGMGTLSLTDRVIYVLSTVTCVDPGRVMPGALDTADYMCLLQGSIWTFRWGAVAYIATAVLHGLGLLSSRCVIAAFALALPSAYAVLQVMVLMGVAQGLEPMLAGLRLGYPFVLGMAAFAYRDSLPTTALRKCVWVGIALGVAAINYTGMPWTPLIEVAATGAVGVSTLFIAGSRGRLGVWLENWPPLALPVFLLNWPVAQLWIYLLPDVTSGALIALTIGVCLVAGAVIATLSGQPKSAFSPPPLSQAKIPRTA